MNKIGSHLVASIDQPNFLDDHDRTRIGEASLQASTFTLKKPAATLPSSLQ